MPKLIVLQEGADLDALSSAYGVMLLYEDAFLLKPNYLSKRASEVLSHFKERFRVLEEVPESFDLVLVDSHDYEEYMQRFGKRIGKIYIFDHHPSAPKGFEGKVDAVGSCTTLIVEEFMERGKDIDSESATILALGIYEDTGMLTYEGTTHRDARAVEWLLQKGLNLRVLRNFLSGGISKEHIDLLSKHLISLESLFVDGKKVSLVVLRMEEYKPDLLSLVYELREIRESSAFFVIVEAGGKTYLFGRSLKDGFDVSEVLKKLGGGGHEFASAGKFEKVSGERLKSVLEAMLRGEKVLLKVGDVMSYPPFLLHEDMDVNLALLELSQRNFAGAPVIDDDGRLVGVVYKKNLLKAQKHGLSGRVKDFMVEEFHTLTPEDLVWDAENILSRYGEKLIPVLSEGRVVGVITRLDLLYAYRKHIEGTKAYERKLTVPEELKPMLEKIGNTARELGYRVYLVGGVVRDLLMKKGIWDLDLVVEGDAIKLAKRLAEEWIVDCHAFPDFGTAHIKVGGYKLEFATTRRETYPHPGSYPMVEWATLREDLLRRDFTINAMALSINPEDFGTLIDYFGGLRDLKDRIIRVLHPMSFVEDPVRILRALRFAGRFDFKLSKGTEKLLRSAVEMGLIKRSPKGRLLNELRLALREEKLLEILKLYKKYQVLGHVIEGFEFKAEIETSLEKLREIISWHRIEFPQERIDYGWVYLLLLIKDLKKETGELILKDISSPSWVRESYKLVKESLHRVIQSLKTSERNSEVYLTLKGKPTAFLLILMVYQRDKVKLYLEKLRHVRVEMEKFKGLEGRELGQAIEKEKLRLMDSLLL